jgi:hypothetical protein
MKTYYVKSRTGEIRPIVTMAYIVPSLRTDLVSVNPLNRQGNRVMHDADPEESGLSPVFNRKIDQLKSFAFMSEHSNLFISKQKPSMRNNLARSRVMRNGTEGYE